MTQINLKPLKEFALKKLPISTLRDIILSEKDVVDAYEFVIKLEIWLRLLKLMEKEVASNMATSNFGRNSNEK